MANIFVFVSKNWFLKSIFQRCFENILSHIYIDIVVLLSLENTIFESLFWVHNSTSAIFQRRRIKYNCFGNGIGDICHVAISVSTQLSVSKVCTWHSSRVTSPLILTSRPVLENRQFWNVKYRDDVNFLDIVSAKRRGGVISAFVSGHSNVCN